MTEVWRDVKGFETRYRVSSLGRVMMLDSVVLEGFKGRGRAIKPRHLLKPRLYRGRLQVGLFSGGRGSKKWTIDVARLVAVNFICDAPEGNNSYAWHVDGDTQNCRAENLTWLPRSIGIRLGQDRYRKKLLPLVGQFHKEYRYDPSAVD